MIRGPAHSAGKDMANENEIKPKKSFVKKLLIGLGITAGVLLLLFFAFVMWLWYSDDPDEKPEDKKVINLVDAGVVIAPVAAVREKTHDDGTVEYIYDKDGTVLKMTAADDKEIDAAKKTADQVVSGTADGKEWTAVTDSDDKTTIYMSVGKTVVKTEVKSQKDAVLFED